MNKLLSLVSHQLVRNTVLATGWQGIRVLLQAVWVILLARAVGPGEYGTFAGLAGLAAVLGSLTGLGFGVLMLQDASRNRDLFPVAWKRALYFALGSGIVLWVLYMLLVPYVFQLPTSPWTYAAIGLPELVCLPITIVASFAFQLHERMSWAGALFTLIAIGNVLAVSLFLTLPHQQTLGFYLPFHAAASILASVCAVALVLRLLAPSKARLSTSSRDMREGLGFSLMRVADTGMTSLDKTLVLLLAGSHAAGIYGSAYRFVAVLAMPATSMGMAVLPRLFRSHDQDPKAHSRLVVGLLAATTLYGLIAAALAYALSGLLPLLFGEAFSEAAHVARWLALFPLLYGLYAMGCNVLVTSNRRTLRIIVQSGGIATLAITAWWSIPRYGLEGAAGMLLFTQLVTTLLLWGLIFLNRCTGSLLPSSDT